MKVLSRFLLITKVLLAQLVFHNFNSHRDKSLGVRIRESCQRLGPTFMKIGQLLSTRYDLFSKEDCMELQKLLDRIPPFRYDLLREVFLHDFGSYPENIFKSFEKMPMAAASIAQTHVAYLKTGEKVAVKVRRPFIGKRIETDMRLIKILAFIGEIIMPRLKYLRGKEVLKEIEELIHNEIDFRHEAHNIEKIDDYIRDVVENGKLKTRLGRVLVPKVYRKHCSYNILTMEFMEGIPLNKCKEVSEDPDYDPLLSVNAILSASFRSLFENQEYYFHGDPHPANLLMRKNGDIVMLDYGVMGSFSKEFANLIVDFVISIYVKDLDGLVTVMSKMAQTPRDEFDAKLREDLEVYIEKSHTEGLEYWFAGLLKAFLNKKVHVAKEFGLFARTMVLLHGVTKMLDSEITTMDLIGEDIADGLKLKMKENLKPDFMPTIYKLTEKFNKSPELLNKVLDRYYDNPLTLLRDIKSELA